MNNWRYCKKVPSHRRPEYTKKLNELDNKLQRIELARQSGHMDEKLLRQKESLESQHAKIIRDIKDTERTDRVERLMNNTNRNAVGGLVLLTTFIILLTPVTRSDDQPNEGVLTFLTVLNGLVLGNCVLNVYQNIINISKTMGKLRQQ